MDKTTCPECGTTDFSINISDMAVYICNRCGRVWTDKEKAMPDEA
jgi:RNA polymerase subunit RPABC4/transcription elongation factor Spt4